MHNHNFKCSLAENKGKISIRKMREQHVWVHKLNRKGQVGCCPSVIHPIGVWSLS